MPRSRARDDDQLMDLGFSGGKAYGGFPSCLLTGAGREPGQECEAPPTGGLLLMRFLSCAIHRLGDGKSVLSERAASSKRSCLWGLGGSALNKQPGIFAPAKIPGLASVGPTRHCLPFLSRIRDNNSYTESWIIPNILSRAPNYTISVKKFGIIF